MKRTAENILAKSDSRDMSPICQVADDLVQMQTFLDDEAISEIDIAIDVDITELDIDELVESVYGSSTCHAGYEDRVPISPLSVIPMATEPTKGDYAEPVHRLRADADAGTVVEANDVAEADAGGGADSRVVPNEAMAIDCLLNDIDDGADRVVLDMPEPVVEPTPMIGRSSSASWALDALNTREDLESHIYEVPVAKAGWITYCGPPPHCDYCGPPPRCDWSFAALR